MAKVCYILNSFNIGGIERVTVSLANALSKYHKIDLFVLKNQGDLKTTLTPNVNVVSFEYLNVKSLLKPLVVYLKEAQPDFLVTSIYPISVIGKFSLKIAKSSCRLIITHHALFDIENKKNPVFDFFLLKIIRNTYNWAYRTFAVSKGVFDFLKRIGVRNVEIMFNPIDIEEKKHNAYYENENIAELGKYVLFLGRLAPIKNIELIEKAFALFITDLRYKSYNFVIIGNGPEEEKLKKLAEKLGISEKCKFLGSKGYPEAYIKNADLLLMASFSEAMPVTVMEAFSFNVPVVTTPARGCMDIFELLGYEYYTNSFDDEDEYCNLMKTLIEKKDSFSWLAQKISENYGTESIISKWNEILR